MAPIDSTKEWIGILTAELPTPTSEFMEGSATFCILFLAPPSSSQIAGWSCRLVVQRRGVDIEEAAEFTVVAGLDDAPAKSGAGNKSPECRVPAEHRIAAEGVRAARRSRARSSSHRAGIRPRATSGCGGSGSGTPIRALAHRGSMKWSTDGPCSSKNT